MNYVHLPRYPVSGNLEDVKEIVQKYMKDAELTSLRVLSFGYCHKTNSLKYMYIPGDIGVYADIACYYKHIDVLKYLLELGAVGMNDWSASFNLLGLKGDFDTIKIILNTINVEYHKQIFYNLSRNKNPETCLFLKEYCPELVNQEILEF